VVDDEVWAEALKRVKLGETVYTVAKTLGLAEATLRYRAKGRPQVDGSKKQWAQTDHHGQATLTVQEVEKLGVLIFRAEQAATLLEAYVVKQRAEELYRARTRLKQLPSGVKFGFKWLRGLRRRLAKRGFQTSSRLPQALEADRAAALTPERTRQCLELWATVRATGNDGGPFAPEDTYIVDEIGHGGKPRPGRVLVAKGGRRVYQRFPARMESYTQVACFNMKGQLLPSALIFHGASASQELLQACGDWACVAKPKSHRPRSARRGWTPASLTARSLASTWSALWRGVCLPRGHLLHSQRESCQPRRLQP
jgi:hypothetical protein